MAVGCSPPVGLPHRSGGWWASGGTVAHGPWLLPRKVAGGLLGKDERWEDHAGRVASLRPEMGTGGRGQGAGIIGLHTSRLLRGRLGEGRADFDFFFAFDCDGAGFGSAGFADVLGFGAADGDRAGVTRF